MENNNKKLNPATCLLSYFEAVRDFLAKNCSSEGGHSRIVTTSILTLDICKEKFTEVFGVEIKDATTLSKYNQDIGTYIKKRYPRATFECSCEAGECFKQGKAALHFWIKNLHNNPQKTRFLVKRLPHSSTSPSTSNNDEQRPLKLRVTEANANFIQYPEVSSPSEDIDTPNFISSSNTAEQAIQFNEVSSPSEEIEAPFFFQAEENLSYCAACFEQITDATDFCYPCLEECDSQKIKETCELNLKIIKLLQDFGSLHSRAQNLNYYALSREMIPIMDEQMDESQMDESQMEANNGDDIGEVLDEVLDAERENQMDDH